VESFSATLLVEGGGNQLIYRSCSHLLKTSMRRRKEVHTGALTRLASPCPTWMAQARAQGTYVTGLPKSGFSPCRSAVSFCSFWSFGLLSPKRSQLRVLLVIAFHKVGFPDYISRPPATLKCIKSITRVLPLLTVAVSLSKTPSQLFACTGDWASRSPEPLSLWSCIGRRRIRFLGSAFRATAPKLCHGSSSDKIQLHCVPTSSPSG
jgi:hypothetical protein